MPLRGVPNPRVDYNFDTDPTWIAGSTYGTGLQAQSSDNPMIDAYYKANPYVGQVYHKTWVDKLFGGIFRTGYDKWRDEMSLNAAQYDASVVDLQQQLSYDSDAAKAERMRVAGMNPDLLGTADSSDSPGLSPDVQDAQLPEADDVLSIGASVASGVLNLIPQVLSFATTIQQLKGIRVDNDAKELAFGQNAMQAAEDFFLHGITEQDYRDAFEKNDWTNVLNAAQSNSKYMSETLFSDKRARDRFSLLYGMHSRSLAAKMQKYKSYEDFEKARHGALFARSHSWFSDDDETEQALLESFLQPLEKFNRELAEYNRIVLANKNPQLAGQLENKQMQNQLVYEQTIDPAQQARTENAVNETTEQAQKIMSSTNQLFEDIMDFLKTKDNWWSKIAMSMVGIARAQLLSGMSMHFQRQSRQQVNGDTGVVTEISQSNFGASM